MGTPYFGFTEKGLAKQNTLQGEGLQKGLERPLISKGWMTLTLLSEWLSVKRLDEIPLENFPFIHNLDRHAWSGTHEVHLFLRYPNLVIFLLAVKY